MAEPSPYQGILELLPGEVRQEERGGLFRFSQKFSEVQGFGAGDVVEGQWGLPQEVGQGSGEPLVKIPEGGGLQEQPAHHKGPV